MKKMAYNYLKFFLAFILVINTVFVCSPFAFADESTKRELTVVEEDVMMRSDFEKHYIMSDGSRIALSYPEAVNYEYNGEWLEVDNTLSLKRGRYENNNKEFSVSFSDDLRDEDVVSLVFDGYTMSWTLDIQQNNRKSLSLSEDAEVVVLNPESIFENTQDSGSEFATSTDRGEAITLEKLLNYSNNNSEIIYDNAFGSNFEVDLSYKLSHNKVKEDIIFNKETEFSALVVTIDANGLEPNLMDDNSVIFTNMKGEIIFNLEAPYMYDAVGAYLFDINVKLERTDEGWVIIYIPDSKWLLDDSRVYPLIFDPTVTSSKQQSNFVDTYVHSGDSPGDHNTELYLRVGLYNSQIHRSYLKINQMPIIPSNAIIFYSTLTLNLTSGTSTGGDFSIYRVMSSWNETGISYSNQPGSNLIVSGVPCDSRKDEV